MRCLFLDYRPDFSCVLADKLGNGFKMTNSAAPAERHDFEVILVAVPPPEHPVFEEQISALAAEVRNLAGTPVVGLLPAPDHDLTLRLFSEGVYDCFVETDSLEELRIILRRAAHFHELTCEVEQLRQVTGKSAGFASIITATESMKSMCKLLDKVAATSATVLLLGESGTGKGLVASAIHKASPRAARPFIAFSCASLPEHLIEAELFGHEKGAFTGAVGARLGRFEAAGQGTIFIDEIGDLPPTMQVKLLRALQEHTFERLGSNQPRPMEARVICATHRPLKKLAKEGLFRADLYYRISTMEVELPPLRKRRSDILLLAHIFLRKFAAQHERPATRFSASVLAALQEHSWPGNVRELQNVVERAVVVCDTSEIRVNDLPGEFAGVAGETATRSFEDEVRSFKRRLIERTLSQTDCNKVQAARLLGIARSSLHRLIDELHVQCSYDAQPVEEEEDDLHSSVMPSGWPVKQSA